MSKKSKKYNRVKRQAGAKARKAPESLADLKARLAQLPKFGESKREIARLTAKIAELETQEKGGN